MGEEQATPLPSTLPLLESQVVGERPGAANPTLEKIGAVAQRSGLPVKTIRFYCDQGLLKPRQRSDGHFRLFDDTVYGDLTLIRTLRGLDIPLPTIAAVLEARRSGMCTCAKLKATIHAKAGEIQERINDLQALHQELAGMLASWQPCGGKPTQPQPVANRYRSSNTLHPQSMHPPSRPNRSAPPLTIPVP